MFVVLIAAGKLELWSVTIYWFFIVEKQDHIKTLNVPACTLHLQVRGREKNTQLFNV